MHLADGEVLRLEMGMLMSNPALLASMPLGDGDLDRTLQIELALRERAAKFPVQAVLLLGLVFLYRLLDHEFAR